VAVTTLHTTAGVVFIAVGVIASVRRPRNRVGLLMTAAGASGFITDLRFLPGRGGVDVDLVLGVVTFAVMGHLAIAFPSGRVTGRVDRAVVASGYAWTVLANVHRVHPFLGTTDQVQLVGNIVLSAAAFAVVVHHRRIASLPARRAMAPALWSAMPILAVIVGLNVTSLITSPVWLNSALATLTPVAVMTLPIAFLAGILRAGLARLAIGHLVVELREPPLPGRLRDVLARALGDPSVAVAYLVSDGWVDADGHRLALPRTGSTRSYTLLERGGTTVAALVHDRSLDDEPGLVEAIAAATSLALENERLQAEVRARLEEVRASRVRIVEAADAARLRVQRDLHDGAQQRLVAVALRLGALGDRLGRVPVDEACRDLAEASGHLRTAITELRELSGGLHPSILVESGLGPALESLAESAAVPVRIEAVPGRRLAAGVESAAYFTVSEALANASKHARARSVRVSATCDGDLLRVTVEDDGVGGADAGRGTGLSGLADRLATLDGVLVVDSPSGGGTRLVAELPCA
ncbi:MAG TPA: histidine kinase, partial [Candidatus Dormibacteraeota bacterium]|nr:histidine kinase [Candidatus Dormibacteraeota bacterium]